MAKDATVIVERNIAASSAVPGSAPISPLSSRNGLLPPAPTKGQRLLDEHVRPRLHGIKKALINYAKFVGPGFMIAVAYSMCLRQAPNSHAPVLLLT